MSLSLVEAPTGPDANLWIWSMGDLQPELRRAAPGDCVVYFFNGAGTSQYEHPPTIEEVVLRYPPVGGDSYRHIALAAWSAGGRAVQRQLDAAFASGHIPDAVLLADALYAPLAAGVVDVAPLASAIEYAVLAAQDPSRLFVMWHSSIPTPGYASSSQCAEAVRRAVEARTGAKLEPFEPPPLDGRAVESAYKLGRFILLEYAGAGKTEHIAEAHMIDEAIRAFVPWATSEGGAVPGAPSVPPGAPHEPPAGSGVGDDDRFARALVEAASADVGVREEGGNNRGRRVEQFQLTVGIPPGSNYCAAAVTTWLEEAAAATGTPPPVQGSAAAKAFVPQFVAAGRWVPRAALAGSVQPGMVLVWDRGGWRGHIGVVESVDNEGIHTIEANAGPNADGVVRNLRQLADPTLLGGGRV